MAAVPGDPFKLGQLNAVNTLTRLAGNTDNAMLRINNASAGANATALDLQVAPGKPPMKVNSTVEVQGLNVDQVDGRSATEFLGQDETAANARLLDGQDSTFFAFGTKGKANDADNLDGKDSTAFVPTKTYGVSDQRTGDGGNQIELRNPKCDQGDLALNGGFAIDSTEDIPRESFALGNGWNVLVQDKGVGSFIAGIVTCADLPPLR